MRENKQDSMHYSKSDNESENNNNGEYRPIKDKRPELLDVGPILTEKTESEIKDMMRNHRTTLIEKVLNLWYEAYTTNNKQRDMQMAIALTVNEIQNIDAILRLCDKEDQNKKQKEKL
jgi:hypothetical protein